MDDVLKSNFKVKNPVLVEKDSELKESLSEQLKKKALSSLGGSMVYVERTSLQWDPEMDAQTKTKE